MVTALIGTILLVLNLSSVGGLVWTGTPVHGSEQGGLVYYTYGGHVYTLDDLGSFRTGPRTVYVDPSNPGRAVLNHAVWGGLQLASVAVPYLLALGFAVGTIRRKRFFLSRQRLARENGGQGTYGIGLDDGTMQRLLERQRTVPRPPSSPTL